MRECEYYEELISRLVDSELNKSEYDALWLHIKDCSRCNAMYAVFNAMSDILSDEAEPLPEGLHENIMAGVRRSAIIKKNRRLTISKPVRNALAAAACAAFVLFAVRGLAPAERAKGIAVTNMDAASIDASAEGNVKTAGKAGKAAEPAQTESPVEAEVQAEAPAQAAPTVDIYLSDFGSEAEAPAESSPAPAQMPLVNLTPQVTAAPAPVVQLTPVPADSTENTETGSDEEPSQNNAAGLAADPAPTETEVQAEAPAIPTAAVALPEAPVSENTEAAEVDSSHSILGRTFMSLFASAPAPKAAEEADAVQTADPSADSAEDAAEPVSESEKVGDKKKNDKSIKATISDKKAVNDFLDLLSGKEEKLPESEPDKVFKVKIQLKDKTADRNLKVLFFGKDVYYVDNHDVDNHGAGTAKTFLAKCSIKEFETFIKEFEDKLPEPAEGTAAPESSGAPAAENGEKQVNAAKDPEPTVDPYLSTPAPDLSDTVH